MLNINFYLCNFNCNNKNSSELKIHVASYLLSFHHRMGTTVIPGAGAHFCELRVRNTQALISKWRALFAFPPAICQGLMLDVFREDCAGKSLIVSWGLSWVVMLTFRKTQILIMWLC